VNKVATQKKTTSKTKKPAAKKKPAASKLTKKPAAKKKAAAKAPASKAKKKQAAKTKPSVAKKTVKKPTVKKTVKKPAAKKPAKKQEPQKKYLVIKHGALGDFMLATGPFAAIRRRHPKSHIVLLTTLPFAQMAAKSPYFDEVWVDNRPSFLEVGVWRDTLKNIKSQNFKMVYDLQTSFRSNMYFRLLGRKKPLWSGNIDWCSHPHVTHYREELHTIDRQKEQLMFAGIKHIPRPDISWLKSDISKLKLPKAYAVIVAGGSAHRPEKRWTEKGYEKASRFLMKQGIAPVFVGGKAEEFVIDRITSQVKGSVNLCGKTTIADLAEMGRKTMLALGNDTGPMHVLALGGAPTIVLFSDASNPDLCAPRGKYVRIIQEEDLQELPARDVISMIEELLELDS
jgi:ADP-heptose:LPS heptosyltransferase